MRKKGYKGRCEKKALSKCREVCRTYSAIQSVYAEMLQQDNRIQEIQCNVLLDVEMLDTESRRFVYEHYSLIAGILPFVSDKRMKNHLIAQTAVERNVSQRTIGNYLCLYLAYQSISAFVPKQKNQTKLLSQDEKNMRWALNRYFYNRNKNSITTAYTMMLKEKYCDASGILLPEYPSIHQFR